MSLRLSLLVIIALASSNGVVANEHIFHRENVLGTSLELRVRTSSQRQATEAEAVAMEEITRLRSVLSSYEPDTEVSKFIAAPIGQRVAISRDLYAVLALCDEWQHVSRGAFNPATAEVSHLWKTAAQAGRRPTGESINIAAQSVRQKHWRLDQATGTAVRLTDARISLNAVAKGYILDRVAQKTLEANHVTGVMINIGGDIRVAGDMVAGIGVANPNNDTLGADTLSKLTLSTGGVATSGSSERSFQIDGTRFSHIIDPRTGSPSQHVVSATVVAPSAATADALATICSVLTTTESLSLVNSMPAVECMLVSSPGVVATSLNWRQQKKPQADNKKQTDKKKEAPHKKPDPTGHEMLVEFEIGRPNNSRRYRRPYVAVWIEDKDKFPVKTLSLFLMQNNPGPRWYRDVRRWYADDQIRKLANPERDIIKTVSKPTRNPGKYKVAWDGRDDDGKLLKPGKYTLLIEAAREHGTYQLIKQDFEFGKSLKKTKLKGNAEIAAAGVTYTVKPMSADDRRKKNSETKKATDKDKGQASP